MQHRFRLAVLLAVGVVYAALVVQLAWVSAWAVAGAVPHVPAVAVAALLARTQAAQRVPLAALAGLSVDLATAGRLGPTLLAWTLVAAVLPARTAAARRGLVIPPLAAALCAAAGVSAWLVARLAGDPLAPLRDELIGRLIGSAYTSGVALLLVLATGWMFRPASARPLPAAPGFP